MIAPLPLTPEGVVLIVSGTTNKTTVPSGARTKPLEGRSLLPILHGEIRTPPQALYWEWSGNCAVRQGKWKLVWDTAAKPVRWSLYDIEADRTELHDRATEMPEKVAELKADYTRWAKATGRAIPGVAKKKS